jgi:hypothetical protein
VARTILAQYLARPIKEAVDLSIVKIVGIGRRANEVLRAPLIVSDAPETFA